MSFARLILIMMAAGWLASVTPFRGDQALFLNYAKQMNDGAVLYRDLWDVANPGIFCFYFTAGRLFGFHEDGIHFAEWLWFTTYALMMSWTIRKQFQLHEWPLLPALLIGGWYYATSTADPSHLTKVEGLVALPLWMSVWCACEGSRTRKWKWLFLAGVAGGIAVLFKFAFALCLAAAWLPCMYHLRSFKVVLMPLGVLLILSLPVLFYLRIDAVDVALSVLFDDTQSMLKAAEPAGFTRLAMSVHWFLETVTGPLILAVAGSFLLRDRFVISYWLMLPAAAVVILIQKWSWWSYHFLLLAFPLIIIACYTWPVLKRWLFEKLQTRQQRSALWIVVALLFLPPFSHGGLALLRLKDHRFGVTAQDREAARGSSGQAYSIALEEAGWLSRQEAGTVFVAGDPLILAFAGRPQSSRYHGWSLELFSPELWQRLADDLERRAPVYVYVASDLGYQTLMTVKAPSIDDWLKSHYQQVRQSTHGVWYKRREPGPPVGP